jgi:hypothetical protein
MTQPPDFDPQLYYTRLAKTETWTPRPCRSASDAAIAEASLYEVQPATVEVSTDQQTIHTYRVKLQTVVATEYVSTWSSNQNEPSAAV